MIVVRICWNEYLSKANKKIDEKWGLGHIVLHEFLSKTNKDMKNIRKLSNYVGMIFSAKQTTKM